MFETLDKLMLAGLGAVSMTRERAEKIFDEYVSRGQAEKTSRSGFVKDLVDSAEEGRKNLEKLVSDQVRKVVSELNIATREDIKHIETKLDKILHSK
ncbi:MAG TPA: hypothetical protein PLP05_01835 [Sedimentisphaerales bacterium]|nr:hypothetical protein [Sedimentisphaerales bacterium]